VPVLDGARVPLVAESQGDDDEEDVEDQHHDAHALRHLPPAKNTLSQSAGKQEQQNRAIENEKHQKESSGYLPSTSHARKMAQKLLKFVGMLS
jgi:hypothetical protein